MRLKKNSMENLEINDNMLEDFTNFENMMVFAKTMQQNNLYEEIINISFISYWSGKAISSILNNV